MSKAPSALCIVVASSLASCFTFHDSIEDTLQPTVIRILRSPESFEILTLDPTLAKTNDSRTHPLPPERVFHGHAILGHAPLNDEKQRSRLVEQIFKGILHNDGRVAAYFTPNLGLRAVKEGHVVDLLISYECLQLEIYSPEPTVTALTANDVEPLVVKVFEDAGLTVPR